MLQAETKITTLIVESMVTRLNQLAKHVSYFHNLVRFRCMFRCMLRCMFRCMLSLYNRDHSFRDP